MTKLEPPSFISERKLFETYKRDLERWSKLTDVKPARGRLINMEAIADLSGSSLRGCSSYLTARGRLINEDTHLGSEDFKSNLEGNGDEVKGLLNEKDPEGKEDVEQESEKVRVWTLECW